MNHIIPRSLTFEGATNFRELGGYPAAGGRNIKHGLFYRGGTLHDLQSDHDRKLLVSLGLRLVLDLRSGGERQSAPEQAPEGARYLPLSAIRYENGDEIDFSPDGMERMQREFAYLDDLSVIEALDSYYKRMPFNNPAYKGMFDAMEQGEVPMLFHCTSGKDRTGVASMLILMALGASRETIIADYMETNRCRSEELRKLEQNYSDVQESDPDKWEMMVIHYGVLPRFINASLEAIESRYGSCENYLEKEYGLDQKRLNALRERYLE